MNDESSHRVVVGVDGSPPSMEALRWALEYARRREAEVDIVTAWKVPWTIYLAPTFTEADYERAALTPVNEAVRPLLAEMPDVVARHTAAEGPASLALVRAAEGAELLVVGSHGGGALPGMHIGSVANYCVHHAPCPVHIHRTARSGR